LINRILIPNTWLTNGLSTRATRRVKVVEQKQLTPTKHLCSSPVFHIAQTLVFCVVLSISLLVLYFFCPSICGFWLPFWYLGKRRYVIAWCTSVITKNGLIIFINRSGFWIKYIYLFILIYLPLFPGQSLISCSFHSVMCYCRNIGIVGISLYPFQTDWLLSLINIYTMFVLMLV
jgi:hypothetical protein